MVRACEKWSEHVDIHHLPPKLFNSARRISMKITVLSILILMLVAGLAMVQMDANTENQIKKMSETEMLKTQGSYAVDGCEEFSHVPVNSPHRTDFCKTKDCQTIWNGLGWSSYKQWGHAYVWCLGKVNNSKDCLTANREGEGYQECGRKREYWGPYCNGWFARPFLYNLLIESVQNTPHNPLITL